MEWYYPVLGGALREPLVRTVHSYAFAILRLQAQAHNNPPPRLITGSEQDVVLRELLAGQPGQLVEISDTETMFSNPTKRETEDYISGRFG